MTRHKKPRAPISPLQRLYNASQVANDQSHLEVITPEQRAKGTYQGSRTITNRSNIVDKWFAEGEPGFEEGARLAIEWCHKRWESRGIIGKQSASYEPTIPGSQSGYDRDIEMRDELDEVRGWFHPGHWLVYENVVRWGQPAGSAGSDFATNTPQAISYAKAVVGLIANHIAMRRGY